MNISFSCIKFWYRKKCLLLSCDWLSQISKLSIKSWIIYQRLYKWTKVELYSEPYGYGGNAYNQHHYYNGPDYDSLGYPKHLYPGFVDQTGYYSDRSLGDKAPTDDEHPLGIRPGRGKRSNGREVPPLEGENIIQKLLLLFRNYLLFFMKQFAR